MKAMGAHHIDSGGNTNVMLMLLTFMLYLMNTNWFALLGFVSLQEIASVLTMGAAGTTIGFNIYKWHVLRQESKRQKKIQKENDKKSES